MIRFVLPLFLLACGPRAVSEADLPVARARAEAWLAAVERMDCDALLGMSQTAMTRLECTEQAVVLRERFVHVLGVETVRESPTEPGVAQAEARVVEEGNSERILTLQLVRSGGDWVVRL